MGKEDITLDWRGRPSNPTKHGGMRAAAFVLGLQSFEIMGIAAVGNNLITYEQAPSRKHFHPIAQVFCGCNTKEKAVFFTLKVQVLGQSLH
ncbi:hypothetical protein L3X38_009319 [Prunus dulcis]|uniref:Uncharacterized protein n=1 Tax=Prunus dulcis TaxID=3755 RepID=A0AAD4ZY76_PRUDU|nr:hypothetical protein L3X38_009319 [Prunus dulcis]